MLEVKLNYEKGESRYSNLKNIDDAYSFYVENYKSSRGAANGKEYRRICVAFLKEVVQYVLEGNHFKIPFGLGKFFIEKRKNKKKLDELKVDWQSTVELWDKKWRRGLNKTAYKDIDNKPLVRHLNVHTRGYYYRWHWTRGRANNIKLYSFLPVRGVTRGIAKAVKGDKDYLMR